MGIVKPNKQLPLLHQLPLPDEYLANDGGLGRLYLLQVIRHDYYADLSQGNRVRTEPIPASRGLILDRNGTVLVDNEPAYQLELTREQVPNLDDTLKRLAQLGLIDKDEVDETRHMILSRRIAWRQEVIFEDFPDALDLMTVCVEAGLSLDAALMRDGVAFEVFQ